MCFWPLASPLRFEEDFWRLVAQACDLDAGQVAAADAEICANLRGARARFGREVAGVWGVWRGGLGRGRGSRFSTGAISQNRVEKAPKSV